MCGLDFLHILVLSLEFSLSHTQRCRGDWSVWVRRLCGGNFPALLRHTSRSVTDLIMGLDLVSVCLWVVLKVKIPTRSFLWVTNNNNKKKVRFLKISVRDFCFTVTTISIRNYLKEENFNLAHGLRGFRPSWQGRQEAQPLVVGACGRRQMLISEWSRKGTAWQEPGAR